MATQSSEVKSDLRVIAVNHKDVLARDLFDAVIVDPDGSLLIAGERISPHEIAPGIAGMVAVAHDVIADLAGTEDEQMALLKEFYNEPGLAEARQVGFLDAVHANRAMIAEGLSQ
ncbi:hypothetical protein HY948_04280 [Candidatus Gottesmanbacteria bacterium]|nr:hypothetical protein [Candidatus Gottesmanbacteria bacterium]